MWEIPARRIEVTKKCDDNADIVSSFQRRSKGFDIQHRCNLSFLFCDPYKYRKAPYHNDDNDDEEVDTRTFPFSPLSSQEPSFREVTVAIRHFEKPDPSTPDDRWHSTTVSTISPLTSPRELRHRTGTYMESSRRQLFSEDEQDEVESAWIWWSSWKSIMCFLVPVLVFAFYSLKGSTPVNLFSTRLMEWDTARWPFIHNQSSAVESNMKHIFSKDTVADGITVPSTSRDAPINTPLIPITSTGSPTSGSLSKSAVPPTRLTLQSLQQPRLISTPLPMVLTLKPSFGTFLAQFLPRSHWILPLASTMIPGMGWVLIVAVIARIAIVGTLSPIENVGTSGP